MLRRPYYRKALRAWYVLYVRRKIRLGKSREEAFARWAEIQVDPRAGLRLTVRELVTKSWMGPPTTESRPPTTSTSCSWTSSWSTSVTSKLLMRGRSTSAAG
jgi:hypothetical protein